MMRRIPYLGRLDAIARLNVPTHSTTVIGDRVQCRSQSETGGVKELKGYVGGAHMLQSLTSLLLNKSGGSRFGRGHVVPNASRPGGYCQHGSARLHDLIFDNKKRTFVLKESIC
jgi:hypothetical protein